VALCRPWLVGTDERATAGRKHLTDAIGHAMLKLDISPGVEGM
jgi:hypothetical protein